MKYLVMFNKDDEILRLNKNKMTYWVKGLINMMKYLIKCNKDEILMFLMSLPG